MHVKIAALVGVFGAAAVLLGGCSGGVGSSAPSPQWMHFRMNSTNSGEADASGATGNVKWTYQTGGPIFSTAAIDSNGTIYTGSEDGNLYAFNRDGSVRFTVNVGAGISESGPGIAWNGDVVFGADNHTIYDYSTTYGRMHWTFQTHGVIFSSPAFLSDGTVIMGSYFTLPGVASSGVFDGNVYALDAQTGKKKWAYQTGGAVGSSAAVGLDDTVYIGSNDGYMYALNGQTGKLKWKFNAGGIIESSPLLSRTGVLYFGCKTTNTVYALNASTGAVIWSYVTGNFVVSSPAISRDGATIYIGSWDHYVYALSASTGGLRWKFLTNDLGDSSPVVATDGTIYYGSNDGHVYAINPDGTQKWSVSTGPIVYTSVSVGLDGTVYEGTISGKFYAID